MRYPEFIKVGETIGFPAPSCGCATEPYYSAFNNAMRKISAFGYEMQPGPNAYLAEGVGISNTPEKCADELMAMYADADNQALISCGGGELMCEILEYMDFKKIKDLPPKWYMGYSDNTNMTYMMAVWADVASIYGPCISSFGMEPWHKSIKDAFDLFTGRKCEIGVGNVTKITVNSYDKYEIESLKSEENPYAATNATEEHIHRLYIDGEFISDARAYNKEYKVSGRIIGGCMDCLVNLLGTEFDNTLAFAEKYKEEGILWYLEACDLNVMSIRRAMWQMEHAGWFNHVSGFLIGRPANPSEIMGLDCYEAVLYAARKMRVPVIMDMDIGHVSPMMPIIVGSYATVNGLGNDLSITYELK